MEINQQVLYGVGTLVLNSATRITEVEWSCVRCEEARRRAEGAARHEWAQYTQVIKAHNQARSLAEPAL